MRVSYDSSAIPSIISMQTDIEKLWAEHGWDVSEIACRKGEWTIKAQKV